SAKPLTQSRAAQGILLESHLNDCFLWTAGEEMNQIHRIAGRHDAHVVAGELNLISAGFALNHIKRAEYDSLRLFDACPRWRSQADPEQRRIGVGKDFSTDPRQHQHEDPDRGCGIRDHQRPAPSQRDTEISPVYGTQASEDALPILTTMALFHEPRGE